jgi:hypothetical protein
MKQAILIALAACSTITGSQALIPLDITPANIVGKTLIFKITEGSGTAVTSGSWSGTFETSPAKGFTIKRVSGATVDHSTIYSAFSPDESGTTKVNVAEIYDNSGPSLITLTVDKGIGSYSMFTANPGKPATFGVQSGTFTLSLSSIMAPEISVEQPDGFSLTDGKDKILFGDVKLKKTATKKFTIYNTGRTNLTNIGVLKTGKHASLFKVSKLSKTTIAPHGQLSFTVTFKPGSTGAKKATLKILSSDVNENPFEVALTGRALKP